MVISDFKKEPSALLQPFFTFPYNPSVKYQPILAEILGLSYNRITIKKQKTRWGSCSSLGNLNYNLMLMSAPYESMQYVVLHELVHLIELNHSSRFWNIVESIMPNYKNHSKKLEGLSTEYFM